MCWCVDSCFVFILSEFVCDIRSLDFCVLAGLIFHQTRRAIVCPEEFFGASTLVFFVFLSVRAHDIRSLFFSFVGVVSSGASCEDFLLKHFSVFQL